MPIICQSVVRRRKVVISCTTRLPRSSARDRTHLAAAPSGRLHPASIRPAPDPASRPRAARPLPPVRLAPTLAAKPLNQRLALFRPSSTSACPFALPVTSRPCLARRRSSTTRPRPILLPINKPISQAPEEDDCPPPFFIAPLVVGIV
ncbi:hypothetical protein ACLOJK_009034 [Asimina triloba]